MTDIDLKQYRRIYLTLSDNKDGRVHLRATYARPPHGAYIVALMSAGMMVASSVDLMLVSDPTKVPALRGLPGKDGTDGTNGKDGASGSVIVGTVEVVDRALVAVALGLRTINVACPGVSAGQAVLALPASALPAGYAVHNAWVTKKDEIALRITGPALALGASNTLSLAIARIG